MLDRSMLRTIRLLVLPLIVLWLVSAAGAQTSSRGLLWKVERNGRVGWLVGSLHMLTSEDVLPPTMVQAFESADTLVEEADPDELASPAFAMTVVRKAMYTDGRTLEDDVSPATYRRLAERATEAGLPVEMLRRMKPWMAATTLQALALGKGGFNPALGVDMQFHSRATARGIRFVALESGAEQLDFLESAGPGIQDQLVVQNLDAAATEVNEARRIAAAWRGGDAAALEALVVNGLQESPAVYDALIVRRNRAWLPRIQTCVDTARCFVVVGAAHLIGPDGLVRGLTALGYTVTQQ